LAVFSTLERHKVNNRFQSLLFKCNSYRYNTLVQGSAADMMKAAMLRWVIAVSGGAGGGGGGRGGGGWSVSASDVAGRADPSRAGLGTFAVTLTLFCSRNTFN
jgi:hypothetical protein